jgi:hypothetical protein
MGTSATTKISGHLFLPHNLGTKVLSLTICQPAIIHNEGSHFPYKGARLFHIINVCLGCWLPLIGDGGGVTLCLMNGIFF